MPIKKAREHTKKAMQLRRDSRAGEKYGYPVISKGLGKQADAHSWLASYYRDEAKKKKPTAKKK